MGLRIYLESACFVGDVFILDLVLVRFFNVTETLMCSRDRELFYILNGVILFRMCRLPT